MKTYRENKRLPLPFDFLKRCGLILLGAWALLLTVHLCFFLYFTLATQ